MAAFSPIKKIGMLLLAIWLIIHGLSVLFDFSFQGMAKLLGILALAAGILIFIDR
jgi:hypothetical protein